MQVTLNQTLILDLTIYVIIITQYLMYNYTVTRTP